MEPNLCLLIHQNSQFDDVRCFPVDLGAGHHADTGSSVTFAVLKLWDVVEDHLFAISPSEVSL